MPVIGGMSVPNTGFLSGIVNGANEVASDVNAQLTGNYFAGGVRIEPTSYRTEYTAEISEQLLVNVQGGKEFLTDNIAARPRQWRIAGYIPGDVLSDILGVASAVAGLPGINVPYISTALSLSAQITNMLQPQLSAKQKYLESLFYGRSTFQFKTRDNETVSNAVMSELMIERTADAQNKLGIQVVIRELNILSTTVVGGISSPATPISGTANSPSEGVTLGGSTSAVVPNNPTYVHPGPK